MTFFVLAGGVVLCAVIAASQAVDAGRQRRWPAAVVWAVMAVPLLGWAGTLVVRVAANPALLADTPPGAAR